MLSKTKSVYILITLVYLSGFANTKTIKTNSNIYVLEPKFLELIESYWWLM
jgi:hypothetical protein